MLSQVRIYTFLFIYIYFGNITTHNSNLYNNNKKTIVTTFIIQTALAVSHCNMMLPMMLFTLKQAIPFSGVKKSFLQIFFLYFCIGMTLTDHTQFLRINIHEQIYWNEVKKFGHRNFKVLHAPCLGCMGLSIITITRM